MTEQQRPPAANQAKDEPEIPASPEEQDTPGPGAPGTNPHPQTGAWSTTQAPPGRPDGEVDPRG